MNLTDYEGREKPAMDEIALSPALMNALFPDVLVLLPPDTAPRATKASPAKATAAESLPAPDAPKPPQPAPDEYFPEEIPPPAIISLGENRRNICLLLSLPGTEVLPASSITFLEKILVACRLGTEDLAIVNLRLSPVPLAEISRRFSPHKWLLSGITPSSLGLDLSGNLFELQSWNDQTLLCLPPLAEMNKDTEEARSMKRQLWSALQKVFGL